jgi:hypothetical protein
LKSWAIFSAGRRGILVEPKNKHGFKLRLVTVRKHRKMPPQPQRGCSLQPSVGAPVAVRKHLRWESG